jgi:hypothetical protein
MVTTWSKAAVTKRTAPEGLFFCFVARPDNQFIEVAVDRPTVLVFVIPYRLGGFTIVRLGIRLSRSLAQKVLDLAQQFGLAEWLFDKIIGQPFVDVHAQVDILVDPGHQNNGDIPQFIVAPDLFA